MDKYVTLKVKCEDAELLKNPRDKKTKAPKKHKKGIKTMDLILVFIAIYLVAFTAVMIKTFWECGSIPDTLCTCVFAATTGECGAMAWIKTTKERTKERQYEKEDREYLETQTAVDDESTQTEESE